MKNEVMMLEEQTELGQWLISVDQVTLDYGGKGGTSPAIKDVSLDIYPGEFVCHGTERLW
ncbi:hypothetical protein [Lentilactobacillus hilgardii]|uniref:hypothetical protein n=1 Tax=Lentilactobacillus hilgardii TaxID=1588 RepID=UPI003FA60AE2